LEGYNVIYSDADISGSTIGQGSYIGNGSHIVNSKVGRFTSIGKNVHTCIGRHPTTFVSTHPAFYSTQKQAGFSYVQNNLFDEFKYIGDEIHVCEIGNDVWLGNNVQILDGITIGNGSIVGLGSIVTKDIEPYSINLGIPAKRVGYRFSADQIAKLEQAEWWNNDMEWIRKNAKCFGEISLFLQNFKL
jgi:acetyltransferase-like isoleucine patch superfamily enzyme